MQKSSFIIILSATVLFGTSRVWSQQYRQYLEYHWERDGGNIDYRAEASVLPLDKTGPKELELPNLIPENTLFGRWISPLAPNGYLGLVLYQNHISGQYDTMFIDTNGDGSLKDETVIKPYFTDETGGRFGPVKVLLTADKISVSYHLFFSWTVGEFYELRAYSGGWYEGGIFMGPDEVKCRLIDHNVNGAFDDISINPDQSDRIGIGETTDLVHNFMEIDGGMYYLEIAPDGSYIKLIQVPGTMGEVRMSPSITTFTVFGDSGLLNLKPVNGVLRMPAGDYHLDRWISESVDSRNNRWKLKGFFWFGGKTDFQVTGNGQSTLAVGEPIIAALNVTSKSDSTYSFKLNLKGSLNEKVTLTCDNNLAKKHQVHIRNIDGIYNQTFSFEYG